MLKNANGFVLALAAAGIILFGLGWAIMFGFYPIPKWIADARVARLEHSLAIGEPRSQVVSRFGPGVPEADPGIVRYMYTSFVGLCVEAEEGVVVTYDMQGRVQSWQHDRSGSGC